MALKRSKRDKPKLAETCESEKIVSDPFDGKDSRVKVALSDPVEMMLARHHIDDAQYQAAGRVRALHEAAGACGAPAIDYTREHVDGGPVWVGVPDSRLMAADRLAEVSQQIGQYDYRIVVMIAGDGLDVKGAAAALGYSGQVEVKYLSRRFRDALDVLAKFFGFS